MSNGLLLIVESDRAMVTNLESFGVDGAASGDDETETDSEPPLALGKFDKPAVTSDHVSGR
jgi:hypothetical protein